MKGRRRFAEAHEPRRADAARVRADENTRAWRWRTRVPGAEEERASERAFCCTRQLATARRALALAATVASPWSTPVSLLFLLLLLGFSTLYPPLPLSLTRCSRVCLRKKKRKNKQRSSLKVDVQAGREVIGHGNIPRTRCRVQLETGVAIVATYPFFVSFDFPFVPSDCRDGKPLCSRLLALCCCFGNELWIIRSIVWLPVYVYPFCSDISFAFRVRPGILPILVLLFNNRFYSISFYLHPNTNRFNYSSLNVKYV